MKSLYKIAAISLAMAFTACDDSTSASNNGDNGSSTSISCTDHAQCPITLEEGTICDVRDGKIYKVATFGSQTWMVQNLNYYDCGIKGESWCYDENDANCEQYGRLYTWTAAMGLDKSYQKNYVNLADGTVTRGLCPAGYHIPSDAETDILIAYLGDNVDEFNFQYGGRNSFAGFDDLGREAYLWTADEVHSELGGPRNARSWSYWENFSFGGGSVFKDSGLSVRCVKD